MPLFDLNNLRKGLQQTAEGLKKTVADASEKLPDAIRPEKLGDAAKNIAQLGQEAFESLRSKGEETWSAMMEKKAQSASPAHETPIVSTQTESVLAVRDALKIIYGLIAVDGVIVQEEKDKFREIGKELDPSFSFYCNDLIAECTEAFAKPAEDEEDYYDTVHDYLGTVIHGETDPKNGVIRGKLLLWDLLTIAQSDGEYSANEKRLIRYVAKSVGVESATVL